MEFWKAIIVCLAAGLAAKSASAAPLRVTIEGGSHVGSDDPIAHHAVSIITLSSVGSCTGTVIAPHWVLTAAHCVLNKETGEVGTGFAVESDEGDWSVDSSQAIAHEGFDSSTLENDIGLIYLKNSVPSRFSPATLVSKAPGAGTTVYGAGFGIGHSDGGLYKVKLVLGEPDSSDQLQWQQSGTQGVCKGDSGGGVWVGGSLAGVISHYHGSSDPSSGCAGTNYAVSVAAYRGWIAEHTQSAP